MSSLYFELAVFCLFEATAWKFDTKPLPLKYWCSCGMNATSNSGALAFKRYRIHQAQNTTTTSFSWSNNITSLLWTNGKTKNKSPPWCFPPKNLYLHWKTLWSCTIKKEKKKENVKASLFLETCLSYKVIRSDIHFIDCRPTVASCGEMSSCRNHERVLLSVIQ